MSDRVLSQQASEPGTEGRVFIDLVTGKVTLTNGAKPLVLIVDPAIPPGDDGVLRLPRQDDNFRLMDVANPLDWIRLERPEDQPKEQPFIVCFIVPPGRFDRERTKLYVQVIREALKPAMGLIVGPIGSERKLKPVALQVGFAVAALPSLADLSEILALLLNGMVERARQDAANAAAEAARIKKQQNAPAEVINLAAPTRNQEVKPQSTFVAEAEERHYNRRIMAKPDTTNYSSAQREVSQQKGDILLDALPASLRGRGYQHRNEPPAPERRKAAFRVLGQYERGIKAGQTFSEDELAAVREARAVKYAHLKFLKLNYG